MGEVEILLEKEYVDYFQYYKGYSRTFPNYSRRSGIEIVAGAQAQKTTHTDNPIRLMVGNANKKERMKEKYFFYILLPIFFAFFSYFYFQTFIFVFSSFFTFQLNDSDF